MNTLLLITCGIVLFAFTLKACAMGAIRGNEKITKKEFTIPDYKEIRIKGNPQVIYEQKENESPYLEIEIDENLVDILTVESENNVLAIGNRKGIFPTRYIIRTNSTGLDALRAQGSSITVRLLGTLSSGILDLSLSGNGEITGDSIFCTTLKSSVSGKGIIKLKGKAFSTENSIKGNGVIDQTEMQAETVSCRISGGGDIYVDAIQNLNVRISGNGAVTYKGHPKIQQSVSGSGKVIQTN